MRLPALDLRNGCSDIGVERVMSDQFHNPSAFEHLVRSNSKMGDKHTHAPVLKQQSRKAHDGRSDLENTLYVSTNS